MRNLLEKINELIELIKAIGKLLTNLEKLIIQMISIVGWIIILIHLFT